MTSSATTPRRVALVTGGTGGIGGGVVAALTRRGFDVVVSDRAIDPAAADDLKARAAADARLAFVKGDLADLTDHPRFLDEAFAAFGRIDSLVNNAGVSVKPAAISSTSRLTATTSTSRSTRGALSFSRRPCAGEYSRLSRMVRRVPGRSSLSPPQTPRSLPLSGASTRCQRQPWQ